jgi:hypothetical protein
MFLSKKRVIGGKEYRLGREYYDQQKYAEAEQVLRQVVLGCSLLRVFPDNDHGGRSILILYFKLIIRLEWTKYLLP